MRLSRTADVRAAIARRLVDECGAVGFKVEQVEASSHGWWSATFAGTRHRLCFSGDCDGRDLGDRLAALDFAIPGHLVADMFTLPTPDGFAVEALTIEAD